MVKLTPYIPYISDYQRTSSPSTPPSLQASKPPSLQALSFNHERELRTLRTEPVPHPDQGHQQAQARLHSARQPSHDGESHVVHDQHRW